MSKAGVPLKNAFLGQGEDLTRAKEILLEKKVVARG